MTFKQFFVMAIISSFLLGMGFCASMRGESRPPGPAGKRLQIELHAYVQSFTERVKLTPEILQWAVLVLPVMEMRSPAVTYGWALPPPPREMKLWMAIFTFDQDWMLAFKPEQRRVIAAHEVGHMVDTCTRIVEPEFTEDMDPQDIMIADYQYQVLNESCADIVAAQLTNPEGVLELLHHLLQQYSDHNPVIIQRIRVIREYADRLEETHLP